MNVQERERNARVEAWLKAGPGEAFGAGTVLAATDRAARSVLAALQSGRRAQGIEAWATPAVFSWEAWVRELWAEREFSGLMLLNPLQEHALWAKIIRRSETGEALLHSDRLATAAQQAYRLLTSYAPEMLVSAARGDWSGDAAIFSDWLGQFEAACRKDGLISASRLSVNLSGLLQQEDAKPDAGLKTDRRSPLLLIGFDRLLASQTALLDAWGDWRRLEKLGEKAGASADSAIVSEEFPATTQEQHFYRMADSSVELAACVDWLQEKLLHDPGARLLVVVPALERKRGELERALLAGRARTSNPENEIGGQATFSPRLDFEFSLGTPLGRVSVVRSAVLLLRWLGEPLLEAEVDWLLGSGHTASDFNEEIVLAEAMFSLRRAGMERPSWSLDQFLTIGSGQTRPDRGRRERSLPSDWVARMVEARDLLLHAPEKRTPEKRAPLDWAQVAADLLDVAGWPGFRPQSSVLYQARQRWERVLADCGSLGFDGALMDWPEFMRAVVQAVSTAIFATESTRAGIQITEPLESAGLLADGIWFLGAQEEDWPIRGTPHPLLPAALQREMKMPHSSSSADWELAQAATVRLMASAKEVLFSYAEQAGEIEARPSRLLLQMAGDPEQSVPPAAVSEDSTRQDRTDKTECFEDWSRIGLERIRIEGGAATLTSQSLCAFKAFATSRLAAERWEPAEIGLNARQRGQLLHDVLYAVWGGAPPGETGTAESETAESETAQFETARTKSVGVNSLAELAAISNLKTFVHDFARNAVEQRANGKIARQEFAFAARFPKRYLELEVERLTRLVTEWLTYELKRLPFRVLEREASSEVVVAGLTLRVRLDRVDELPDGSLVIVDYKSGDMGPAAWAGDRPNDVQLPLYAVYALEKSEAPLEGLVFGRVRPGDMEYCGRIYNAQGTFLTGLTKNNGLVKDPLTDAQLASWRTLIERLGEDFLLGRAEVDPKEKSKTCSRCHLQAVCRISENQPLSLELSHAEEEDAAAGSDSEVSHD